MLSTLRPAKRKTPDPICPQETPAGLVGGLLNIQGMQDSILELALVLDTGMYLPKAAYLDFLATTETFQNKDGSNVYTQVKKYTWLGKPSQVPGCRQGLGFWIKNHLVSKVTIMEPEKTNDNIMWIRIITKKCILYVAVVYIPFEDGSEQHANEAKVIFATLTAQTHELQASGTVVIMGDLNARVPTITGDTGIENNNKNGVMLKSLLKDADMSVCVNQ